MSEQHDIYPDEAPAPHRIRTRKRTLSRSSAAALVVLAIGLGIVAYPSFSDWWNNFQRARDITDYVAQVQEADTSQIDGMLADARAYNERLAAKGKLGGLTEAEREEYGSLLNLTGNGVMGYVQITSINVSLPIYHGMESDVLQKAIGHMEGSSLPIGGESTHAIVSGHRGLPSARLFTDLDRLEIGDTFSVTVLNQTATYEVDQIRIVLPDDLSLLDIEPGRDYVTLVTCTPYGVNTHRMLVRGHRTEGTIDADAIVAEAQQIPRYIAVPAVALPMLFAFLLVMLVRYRGRRPAMSKDQVIDALRTR